MKVSAFSSFHVVMDTLLRYDVISTPSNTHSYTYPYHHKDTDTPVILASFCYHHLLQSHQKNRNKKYIAGDWEDALLSTHSPPFKWCIQGIQYSLPMFWFCQSCKLNTNMKFQQIFTGIFETCNTKIQKDQTGFPKKLIDCHMCNLCGHFNMAIFNESSLCLFCFCHFLSENMSNKRVLTASTIWPWDSTRLKNFCKPWWKDKDVRAIEFDISSHMKSQSLTRLLVAKKSFW